MWGALVSFLAVVVYSVAVYCAFRAAATARTPQGAVGWVVFLLTTPVLAIPLFMFLGHHRFRDYHIARRESHRVAEGMSGFAERHAPEQGGSGVNLGPFEAIAGMPALRGNGADLLIDGEATFEAILAAIDAAKDYALIQFFIVHDDNLGRALKARMIAAARRGVTVRFMVDAVGSHRLPDSYTDDLRAAGVEVNDRDGEHGRSWLRFRLNYRNHRKTVVIDGRVGFIGGHNVGDEYMGRSETFGPWRDTHIRMRGPVVQQLQLIFVEDWHWATGDLLLDELTWEAERDPQDMTGLIVATGPGDEAETGSMLFFSAITAARERFWIASPYFVPDIDIMAALRNAALRGVDVRIIVPDAIDHYIPWLAAFAHFDELTACGVRIYRYTRGFMHQKVFVVDDTLAAVGTTNLDNRSFRLNFEAMALFFDRRAARAADAMLRADFDNCREMTRTLDQQPWHIRYGAPVARLFSPLL